MVCGVKRSMLVLALGCYSACDRGHLAQAAPAARPDDTVVKRSASDDLPHRQRELAPVFAKATDCIPEYGVAPDTAGDDEQRLKLALDALDGKLVVCAQLLTRRGGSVFLDPVSYACWDVDPATAALTRRPDLGRSYFQCQDGACGPGDDRAVSFDGSEVVERVRDRGAIEVRSRAKDGTIGEVARKFATPAALADVEFMRGDLVDVGGVLLARADDMIHVYDGRGAEVAKLAGDTVVVLDAGHVLVYLQTHPDPVTVLDVATRRKKQARLVPAFAVRPAALGGKMYALDGRELVALDASFRELKRRPLKPCR